MRSMVIGQILIALALVTSACADPSAPEQRRAARPVGPRLAHQRPTAPVSVVDSVGVPPSIPPIFEEVPAVFDSAQ